MRQALVRILALAILLFETANLARAAFQVPLANPQTTAMGGASGSSLGDSSSMFINPAGTSGLIRAETYFSYNQMFAGLNGIGTIGQGILTAGFPTRLGTLSLGVADFRADSLLEERILGLTYSRRIGFIDAGITAKYMYHRYLIGGDALAAPDPAFQNGSARGAISLDGGLIASLSQFWKVSLVVRNINQPNVGLSMYDPVPREFQGGVIYEYQPLELRATADLTYRSNPMGDLNPRSVPAIGFEKRYQAIRFRAGLTPNQFSAGIGIDWGDLGLDYAFVLTRNLVGNNLGSHTIGLRYRFGRVGDNG